ncbi:MAG TPA: 16S rRNA (cytosine(1402)-N(4))-methyltransferase RsmH [Thermoanaerobaculia bacterium]|nr:16S rRNA (cytosine(1402)-N(4))-methyltransferase RsmH [Thermoanaerobaculia bacterium]
MQHVPVLLNEVLQCFSTLDPDGTFVDVTLGLGGHSEALLSRHPRIRLIGIDRDPRALHLAGERLGKFGERVKLIEGRYEALIEILDKEKVDRVDGLLADLGVSSMQLDDPSRGFSFRSDGPLDMRMSAHGTSAADLVNDLAEADLVDLIRRWGEEPMAKRIAKAIIAERETARIETTTRLTEVIRTVKKPQFGKIDPATLTFQALRIATNEEISGLERFVEDAVETLAPEGRIAVISFHSLEDRIVKKTFRRLEGECRCPPGMPVCGCGAVKSIEVLTSRPVAADEEEERLNPRSRSAKMRIAEKVSVRDSGDTGSATQR